MTSAVAIHEEDAGILLVFVLLLTCVGPDLYLGQDEKNIHYSTIIEFYKSLESYNNMGSKKEVGALFTRDRPGLDLRPYCRRYYSLCNSCFIK